MDIYNWAVKFIRPVRKEGIIRLASLEDIAAFKLDAICHRREKKDYIENSVDPVMLKDLKSEEVLQMEDLVPQLKIGSRREISDLSAYEK